MGTVLHCCVPPANLTLSRHPSVSGSCASAEFQVFFDWHYASADQYQPVLPLQENDLQG